MEQQLTIHTKKPTISVNFEAVAQALDEQLQHYAALVVTPDNIKDAKKEATELNKLAGEIDQRRKDAVSEVSAPVKLFETQMKDLRDRCKNTRQGILDQVDRFEDKVREQARQLLVDRRLERWNTLDVRDNYRRAKIDDLIKLSAVTGSGSLAKAARDGIDQRAQEDRSLQDVVDRRFVELERDSYKAGLDAPLTWENVAHFIEADEATYAERLSAVMSAEVEREQQAEARRRAKAEREAATQVAAQAETAQQTAAADAKADVEASAERAQQLDTPLDVAEGNHGWRMTVVFDIETPAAKNITADQLKKHVTNRLKDAGVPAPSYMEAHRVDA